jgi:hypothetical protein
LESVTVHKDLTAVGGVVAVDSDNEKVPGSGGGGQSEGIVETNSSELGQNIGDKDSIAGEALLVGGFSVALFKRGDGKAAGNPDIESESIDTGGDTVDGGVESSEGINGSNSGVLFESLDQFRSKEGFVATMNPTFRDKVDISADGLADPVDEGVPEGLNHKGDANDHGEGDEEGDHGGGGAREAGGDGPDSQIDGEPEEASEGWREETSRDDGQKRDNESKTEKDKKGAEMPWERGWGWNDAENVGEGEGEKSSEGNKGGVTEDASIGFGAGESSAGLNLAGLPGREKGGQNADTKPDGESLDHGREVYQSAGVQGLGEGFRNGTAYCAHRVAGQKHTKDETKKRAERSEKDGFQEERAGYGSAGKAQATENANLATALDDRKSESIIDEKNAYENSKKTEGVEVHLETGDHALNAFGAIFGAEKSNAGRERGFEGVGRGGGGLVENEIDTIDPADFAEEFLGACNVHEG